MSKRRSTPIIETTMDRLVQIATQAPTLVEHNVIAHAGHYVGGGGHDLARWVVRHPSRPTTSQIVALGVPCEAEYHCGFTDRGVQHWVYVERRPMSPGICGRCSALASESLFAKRGLS